MPKDHSLDSRFTSKERTHLLRSAKLIHRQPELDIRSLTRFAETSILPGRILIITPRKIGTAPERNRIRRRFKALFREEKIFSHGQDFLVYCRKGSTDLTFQQLKTILLEASQKNTSRSLSVK
jgi:ribonuclease P protein component